VIALMMAGAACQSGDPLVAPTTQSVEETVSTPDTPNTPSAPWVSDDGTTIRFIDVTESANVAVAHQSPFGSQKDGAEMMGGAAAGDFNKDGFQDLFFIGGGVNPDSLFINDGDGTFTDMAVEAGLTDMYAGSGATVGDFDGDGWLDIFVTSHGGVDEGQVPGRHHLYRNNGDLTFTDVAEQAGVNMTSREVSDGFGAAFGDYDLDGDLDLFVSGWVKQSKGNRLFRNDGDGTFTDVTDDAGIVDDGIRGFSPCIVDTNGDHYPEILLVADFGTSRYFANNGNGTFSERSAESGVGQDGNGMGTAVGDFNQDGLIDWYTTAIFDDDNVGRGEGNKLYINQGNHQFTEVGTELGVADGGWGWGTVAVDLDLDGRLDLVETNGWRLPSYDNEMAKVFIQQADSTFAEVAEETGLHHDLFGLGVIHFDIDNDGDQDIAITAGNDRFYLYETELEGSRPNWLKVVLDTSADPTLAPNGFGAKVQIVAGESSQYSDIVGCSNYLSSSELSAHFGLGSIDTIDRVVVTWPNGSITELDQVATNQVLVIKADAG
jgi:hypothetical protein